MLEITIFVFTSLVTNILICYLLHADPPYGHAQNFRPEPELDNRVYAFHPSTGQIDVLADKFVKPNGIVFSPDYKTVYVTDTGDEDVSKLSTRRGGAGACRTLQLSRGPTV